MKKLLFLLIPFVILGCTTSTYTVSSSADMGKYKYAAIGDVMEYGGSAILFDMDVKIFDLLNEAGISMIGEKELSGLSEQDQQTSLLVKYRMEESGYDAIVSITFVDYITERPVASCRGVGTNWVGWDPARKEAVNNALSQARNIFGINRSSVPVQ